MKRFMIPFMALLICICVVWAAGPSAFSNVGGSVGPGDGWYEKLTPTKSKLIGSGDTSTLAYRWSPKWKGTSVVLVRSRVRNPKADSVGAKIIVQCLNSSYDTLYTVTVDSIVDTAGQIISLPIGSTLVGSYYNIRWLTCTLGGAAAASCHQASYDSIPKNIYIYYPFPAENLINR
jgi:hypothetical protein